MLLYHFLLCVATKPKWHDDDIVSLTSAHTVSLCVCVSVSMPLTCVWPDLMNQLGFGGYVPRSGDSTPPQCKARRTEVHTHRKISRAHIPITCPSPSWHFIRQQFHLLSVQSWVNPFLILLFSVSPRSFPCCRQSRTLDKPSCQKLGKKISDSER